MKKTIRQIDEGLVMLVETMENFKEEVLKQVDEFYKARENFVQGYLEACEMRNKKNPAK